MSVLLAFVVRCSVVILAKFIFLFFALAPVCQRRARRFTHGISSRWNFSDERETFAAKCIIQLSLSSFSVRRLMERRSAVARRTFPRFSVSAVAVTLSYFRRPHRNPKVRLISHTRNPVIGQYRERLPEESSVTCTSARRQFICMK